MTLRQFRVIAGRPAVDQLYLSGQTRFECDASLWNAVQTLARANGPRTATGGQLS